MRFESSPSLFRQMLRRTKAVSAVVALFLAVTLPVCASGSLRTTDVWHDPPSLSATLVSLGRRFVWGEVAIGVQTLIASLLVGGITAWGVLRSRNTIGRRVLAVALAVLFSLALGMLLSQGVPALIDSVPLVLGSLLGTASGAAIRAGRRTVTTLCLGGAVLALVIALGTAGLLLLVSDRSPAEFEFRVPSALEKQRLTDRLKGTQLLSHDSTKPREISFNETETNLLVGWRLRAGDREPVRARVYLGEETFRLLVSKAWQVPVLGERYLHAELTGRMRVDSGQLQLQIAELRIGRLRATPGMCARLERLLVPGLQESADLQPWLTSLESLRVHSGNVEVRTRLVSERAWDGTSVLSGAPFSAPLRQATVEQVEQLARLLQTLSGRPPLERILAETFQRAHEQSQRLDPREANRAALLALGIVFADVQLARLVDYPVSPELQAVLRRRAGRVGLRDRSDWVQHFCGSAALAATAGRSVSNLAGLIKEEIDAGIPGKGFSFGDVLADRAGTRFAQACLSSPETARRMQDRLRGGVPIEELFPAAEGLPEHINEAELTANYGGVGGSRYRQWLEEIEHRLDRTPLLRSP